jgi:manganese/zinc/iron transport system substrate-binding protein
MPFRRLAALALLLLVAAAVAGCGGGSAASGNVADRKIRVTTTTNFITDTARQIGGDRVEVTGLMGPGVDPHLYKASAKDVSILRDADVIFYGGLELEGRMSDLLEELGDRRPTVAVTKDMREEDLIASEGHAGRFDPHVWFDVTLWQQAARTVAATLRTLDPDSAAHYDGRLKEYLTELTELDAYVRRQADAVPERQRVLVTSHDAFTYFGRRYGFEVAAIQGVSTATEVTNDDIERVAAVVADRKLRSVFIESSVPRQTVDSVLQNAADRGQQASVGGELYSDSAGSPGSGADTYVGMVRANIDTISEGLR